MGKIAININDADVGIKKAWDPVKLKQVTEQAVRTLIANNPKQVHKLVQGGPLAGFFVGQVMKATDGAADPKYANQYLMRLIKGFPNKNTPPVNRKELQEAVNKITSTPTDEDDERIPVGENGSFRRGGWDARKIPRGHLGVVFYNRLFKHEASDECLYDCEKELISSLLKKGIDSGDEKFVDEVIINSLRTIYAAKRYEENGGRKIKEDLAKETVRLIDTEKPESIYTLCKEVRSSEFIDMGRRFNALFGNNSFKVDEEKLKAWKEGDYKTVFELAPWMEVKEGEDNLSEKVDYESLGTQIVASHSEHSKERAKIASETKVSETARKIRNLGKNELQKLYEILDVAPRNSSLVVKEDKPALEARKKTTLSAMNESAKKVAMEHLAKEGAEKFVPEYAPTISGSTEDLASSYDRLLSLANNLSADKSNKTEVSEAIRQINEKARALTVEENKPLVRDENLSSRMVDESAKKDRYDAWLKRKDEDAKRAASSIASSIKNRELSHLKKSLEDGSVKDIYESENIETEDQKADLDRLKAVVGNIKKSNEQVHSEALERARWAHGVDKDPTYNKVKRDGVDLKSSNKADEHIAMTEAASNINDGLAKQEVLKKFREDTGLTWNKYPVSRDGQAVKSGNPHINGSKPPYSMHPEEKSGGDVTITAGTGTGGDDGGKLTITAGSSENKGFDEPIPTQWIATDSVDNWVPEGDSNEVHAAIHKKAKELEGFVDIEKQEEEAAKAYAKLLSARREFQTQKSRLNSSYIDSNIDPIGDDLE